MELESNDERPGRWSQVYDRLTRVERDMTAIATGFESVSRTLNRLEQMQTELARQVNTRGRTNWAVVASLAGAVAAILVFYTGLVTSPIAAEQVRMQGDFRHELGLTQRINEAEHAELTRATERLEVMLLDRTNDRYSKSDHRAYAEALDRRLERLEERINRD